MVEQLAEKLMVMLSTKKSDLTVAEYRLSAALVGYFNDLRSEREARVVKSHSKKAAHDVQTLHKEE